MRSPRARITEKRCLSHIIRAHHIHACRAREFSFSLTNENNFIIGKREMYALFYVASSPTTSCIIASISFSKEKILFFARAQISEGIYLLGATLIRFSGS